MSNTLDVRITDRKKFLNNLAKKELNKLLVDWALKTDKYLGAKRIDLVISEIISAAGKAKVYEGGLEVVVRSGKAMYADISGNDLASTVLEGLGEVESQLTKWKSKTEDVQRKKRREERE